MPPTLAILPRLPDTRFELISIAEALEADLVKALYLGKAANEQNVETLDRSHYRIVAFSTHGLVTGDLDRLTQPALALTAPDVAGVKGDGLLTMEKILALKLDADWVVLSACNTAAGAGAGAEAASGLGSAFFYAGTCALLVTNWSVHSASARELITDLFRRQREPGAVDGSGRTVYSYAHPLFWAPYSVIGDGGGMSGGSSIDSILAGAFFTDVQNPAPRGGLEQMVFRSSWRFLYKRSERVTRP